MKTVNVEVAKTGTEHNTSLIRKFTKKVQESGILRRVRGIRYQERTKSKYVKKKKTLAGIERRAKVENLIKLGKNPEILKKR